IRRIMSGYSNASCCAIMPPSENPTTSKFLRSSARQKSAQSFVIAATVDGVSPLELPTPALSTRMTSRSAAKPFVTLGSQSSMFRGPVVENQQGKPAGPTKAPIREPDASDLDELCASGFVRIIGHQHPLLRLFQLSRRLLY